jgi:hypothetical protein
MARPQSPKLRPDLQPDGGCLMPFPSPLTSPNYATVRARSYKSAQYASLCPNTVVFQAAVNQASFADSFAQVTYNDVIVGVYTDIQIGQTVFIGPTDDIRNAPFIGRVRAAPSSSILYINETSAAIQDGWVLTVIDDYRLYHELGRVSGGVYYKDYSQTFTQLKPINYSLEAAYGGWVTNGHLDITPPGSALAATSGATISTYSWAVADGSIIVGSSSSANPTIRFPAGFRWIHLTTTDSGGRTQVRHIPVWAHSLDYLPALGFTGATINGEAESGWSATVDAFSGVDDVADNTLICIWNREWYDDVPVNIVSNVEFVGRLRKENGEIASDETYSELRKVSFELEGPLAQLSRISAPTITMRDANPTMWDEIKNLTPWRANAYLLEHSTFHTLYSLAFDSTSNAYRAFELEAAQGNAFSSVQDISSSINAIMEWTPQGEARIVRDARFLDEDARNALPVIANFTARDYIRVHPEREHVETVGLVEGDGGTYSPTGGGIVTTAVTPQLSIAPGVAQGNAEGTAQLSRQILLADVDAATAQAELNDRLGKALAKSNPADSLTFDMPDRYHWLVPSVAQWYTWTFVYRGIAYDESIRWLLKSVSITHDNDIGTKSVSATFVRETDGAPGQTQDFPAQGSTEPAMPAIPPIQPYPNSPMLPDILLPALPTINNIPPNWGLTPAAVDPVPLNGEAAMIFSEDHDWVTQKFITIPTWIGRTPDDLLGTIRDAKLVGKRGYILSSDGTNSLVHSVANIFQNGRDWQPSETIEGVYGQLLVHNTDGKIAIAGVSSGDWPDNPWFVPYGAWSIIATGIDEDLDLPYIDVQAAADAGEFGGYGFVVATDDDNKCCVVDHFAILSGDVTSVWIYSLCGESLPAYHDPLQHFGLQPSDSVRAFGIQSSVAFTVRVFFQEDCGGGGGYGSLGTLTRISEDYGLTFADGVVVGTSFGAADIEKIGDPVLVSNGTQVRIATTFGGSYSDYGDPLPDGFTPHSLLIPRYRFGSTSAGNVSTNTPQYLIASSVEDDDGATLYKVTSSGTVFTDITPTISGDKGTAIGPYSLAMPWWSGSVIAAVLKFGSLPRLVVSTNAGASWTDRGVLNAEACMVTFRKGDRTMKQLFLANGQPAYSYDRGAHIRSIAYPKLYTDEPIIGIQVYG